MPAYFSDAQRQATREAGEIAGLEVVRIINEPTAAALVYEAAQHQGKRILVYDLGGGTFDVSVVRIEEGVVEVISSHGNNQLGGDDFDHKIVEHVLEHLKLKHGVDVSDQPQAMARILRSAETAKKQLSDHPYARIEEEYLAEHDGKPVNLDLELSRRRVRGHDHAVHRGDAWGDPYRAGIGGPDLLAGGRNPPGRWRHADAADPAPLVEASARIRGARSIPTCASPWGRPSRAPRWRAPRYPPCWWMSRPIPSAPARWASWTATCTPIEYVPIIPKNTPIPVRRSEVFYTVVDGQTGVDVRIYQGENIDALENIKIGEFRVDGLSKAPAGNPVILDLALDRDGILQVSAREKKTGLERRITIDKAMSRYDQTQLDRGAGADRLVVRRAAAGGLRRWRRRADTDLDALLAKASAKARRGRRGGSRGDHRPDRDDPRRQERRRRRCPGGCAPATAGSAVLSRDLSDGAVSALPRHAERRRDVPPVPGRASDR